MSDLTDEAVKALLDDDHIKFFADRLLEVARIKAATEPYEGECDQEDLASYAGEVVKLRRALLDARAELARLRADAQAAVALVVQQAAERLEINRAHLNFEALLGLLRDKTLPEPVVTALSDWLDVIAAAIRGLAPADGLVAVDALRAEIADLKMNMDADLRTMVREGQQLRTLAAELAVAQQREAALTDPICVHVNMLRGTIAKPTLEQIIHLYGVDALCKALMPVIVREAEAAIIRKGGTL